MGEKVIVKEKSIKKGESEKGAWVNTRITGEDGQKFGGFDKNLQYLNAGDAIEITELEIKGQNKNILKWHKIEVGSDSGTPSNGKPVYGKTAEQFEAERCSIEAQTAYRGITDLIGREATGVTLVPDDVKALAFDWARVRLGVTKTVRIEKPSPTVASTADTVERRHFENPGQLALAAFKSYGLNATDLCKQFGVEQVSEIADLDDAWKSLELLKIQKGGERTEQI